MFGLLKFTKRNRIKNWGLYLLLGILVIILAGVSSVYAFPAPRVDAPNPKIEPLVEDDDGIPAITDLADDYYGPGLYGLEIGMDDQVKIVNRWCTKTGEILDQNLAHIYYSVRVNGRDVLARLHKFDEIDFDETGERMYCHGYRGLISDWPAGQHDIQYGITIEENINDGWGNYSAGEITWQFDVTTNDGTTLGDAPYINVSINTNCRVGPGKAYELVGALKVDETAEVVGKYPDADYWIIFDPDIGRECWLWGYYAEVTGNTNSLRIYEAPPLPTPTPTPEPAMMYRFCFCNNTGSYISSIQLFNDDTDQWMGEFAGDGFPPGYCICNCNSTGEHYPSGDYAVQYKICEDGAACQFLSNTRTQGFDNQSGAQMFEITP